METGATLWQRKQWRYYGGRSVEHEVSVITGHQIMDALKAAGHRVLPIYIEKDGEWYAGESLHDLKLYTDPAGEPTRATGVVHVNLSPDRSIRQLVVHPGRRQGLFRKPPQLWAEVFFPCFMAASEKMAAYKDCSSLPMSLRRSWGRCLSHRHG